jgi:hypothetical protein
LYLTGANGNMLVDVFKYDENIIAQIVDMMRGTLTE